MASTAVSNPNPSNGSESKSSKKRREKGQSTAAPPAVPDAHAKENSSQDDKGENDGNYEHPYIKELAKQIRNTHKKLAGMQKIDAIIAENPGTSLDNLVAQRKLNADQKASILKKPQLQQQLATLEEQISQYRKFDAEFQTQLQKQKEDLTAQHQKEMEKVQETMRVDGLTASAAELRRKLLLFSQFLRAAAARRAVEEEADTEESRAFEGALLLVYGGDRKAVDTAVKLIEGADEQVPTTEGELLSVKYSQIKQASIDHEPFLVQEQWAESVAAATDGSAHTEPASDPTIAHAGLTELDTAPQTNGIPAETLQDITSPPQADAGDEAGNAAGDRWDRAVAGVDKSSAEDSYEMVPRPEDELETPASAAAPAAAIQEKTSWADEPPAYDAVPSGNQAGESWDVKAAGDQIDTSWGASEPSQPLSADGWADSTADATGGASQEDGDGFHQVPGRHRGRGRGRGGDGEFRGRGRGRGGFRGDGEFRGRGRGGFRGGRGEGGEFRGRGGGRGRAGPRGGAEGVVRASS